MTAPWKLTLSTILGLGLMFYPTAFGVGIESPMADLNHLGGALVVVVAVVAMAEVLRTFRYFNIAIGLVLIVMPWTITSANITLNLLTAFTGLIIMVLSFKRGAIKESYGLWDKYIR